MLGFCADALSSPQNKVWEIAWDFLSFLCLKNNSNFIIEFLIKANVPKNHMEEFKKWLLENEKSLEV